ncbi:MAG: amidohydrolase [Clostridia bacterium]|nr:amidohydrolase [Clostridia bacterium]
MDNQALIAFFEDLHRHPELGFEEARTTARVREALTAAGIELLDAKLKTGLIAVVSGSRPGRVIGLRCDLDALPMQEESGLPYASEEPGKMHACGHDFHAACMLGAALLLKAREKDLAGTIKIVFQPAEELGTGGAKSVVETGLLSDVQEFYAIHSYPYFDPGTLGVKEGPVMAAPDRFSVTLYGKGAHAAQPHDAIDPVPALAALIAGFQTAVSRNADPFDPAVVTIARVQAGTAWNVIPESALLEGTVRTLDNGVRAMIRGRLETLVASIAAAYGCTADFQYVEGPDPVVNDAALCAVCRDLALRMGFRVDRQEDTMGGEDFSEYLKICPGVFVRVGTGGHIASHHPAFTVDSAALPAAAEYFAALARERAEYI